MAYWKALRSASVGIQLAMNSPLKYIKYPAKDLRGRFAQPKLRTPSSTVASRACVGGTGLPY